MFLISLILLLTSRSLPAAGFGKNTVQYTYFKWKYLTTEHFNIYYNQGGRKIADFTAEVAEAAYQEIAKTYQYSTMSDDPITIVTYQSHNDFEQTNITSQPDESTGGVTEFLKTRIIVPFEGDHEKFRHVIHHELTHAMMLNMMYGQGFDAILSGLSQDRMPLWFIEGLAEYMSHDGLDTETEMYLRDALVNDILPEIDYMDAYGYLSVYKCGQSILYWIAWRYGDEKVGEILHQISKLRNFNSALKAAIGIDSKELSKRWRRFIKERYWTQVAKMEPPDQFARQLTNHEKEYCYVNNSPVLSPNGEWLAFLSNRSDYFDIYLMNTMDGKIEKRLIRGQRSGKFEELHWLQPGITWSPDGSRIALCAKTGEMDALYVVSIPEGKIDRKYQFDSNGLFSPAWSPDGRQIAMVVVHENRSDIVTVELETGRLKYVTNDIFDAADPSWSPDSRRLLFTSNRGNVSLNEAILEGKTIIDFNYAEFDIYELNLQTRLLRRLTNDPYIERTPLWTPVDNTILYVSDKSGAYNIYLHNIANDEIHSITNIVTGTFQPTIARNAGTLAFSSYFNNGYDIFMINDPFGEHIITTPFQIAQAEKVVSSERGDSGLGLSSADYRHYVFDRLYHRDGEEESKAVDSTEIVVRTRQVDGRYPSQDYHMHLEPDMVFVSAGYSPYYLLQGSGLILFTDIMGNHELYISADLNRSTKYSNLFAMYNYLAYRFDIGGGAYHFAYPFYSRGVTWLDRNYGIFLNTSYPINRFNRLEFSFDYSTIDRSELSDYNLHGQQISAIIPHIGYVHDTSIWRWSTAPANGGRWRFDLSWSPDLYSESDNNLYDKGIDFTTLTVDWRRYFAYHKDYTFSFRLNGSVSEGRDPQRFFLGGMMNWFNSRYDNSSGRIIIDMQDIYFSRFVTPLRGVGYYNQVGTRYILGNFEFRYPFIRHLMFGWPLPIYFRDVRGVFFTDVGSAWYTLGQGIKEENNNAREEDYRMTLLKGGQLIPSYRDWTLGFGFGIRLDLGIFPIEWDIAWSEETGMSPQYYFSLNLGF